ncbi:family 78 glycoside hydrolase catalytic domain [Pelagicoccus sp. NFK12]|uniref:alpha-L-rhamnosidase n=1 Tax=Pelagicoccus enzymogenes TaxID=2773457 RepID=A0A927FA68_9BACT|nr:alpha-L-rhamnosidase [Pelagicoccus enzymogenes]MBD5780036.1 family 78 glycoside hydrolase catalytic domain [Pelagicoccus enzymogenes]
MATLNKVPESADTVSSLRCEGLESPRLIDSERPRFSWKIVSVRRGASQGAYQLRVFSSGAGGEILHDSGKVESDKSQWVQVDGFCAKPRRAYQWQLRIWNERGEVSEWSELASFETSLMGEPWPAQWISDGRKVELGEAPPARYFKKSFQLPQKAMRATLYVSALGVVQPWLNGDRVSDDCFSPGWPDYRKRVFYTSYDISDTLKAGENVIGLVLGDGWYSGTLFLDHQYDPTPKVSAWVEILAEDGSIVNLVTDESWEGCQGPIRANGIYFGETFDARLHDPAWCEPGRRCREGFPAVVESSPGIPMVPRHSPPVRPIETLQPMEVRKTKAGAYLYDFGQNMVGWVRLIVKAKAGQEISLRFGEMLESDGELHTANLRTAKASASYIAKGAPEAEAWEPSFTFFGFRYVELSGVEDTQEHSVLGIVVHTDLKRTGTFECSNRLLNKLYSNTLWGQKGNFLELPTDCPQRDERLGWTGDAQVFCHTALYNMDAGAFYRQWLAAVRDSFEDGPDGGFASVAPFTGFSHGAAGWADAGAIVPWTVWLHTGDRALLEENFESVCDWVDLMRESAPDGIRVSKEGWGDWLAPWHPQGEAPTPYRLIATAYYAYSTQIAIWMAKELGRADKVREYEELLPEIKAAFQREYIAEDGKVVSDEQTAYLLALGFDLVQDEKREAMIEHLVSALRAKEDHLSTGFIGTPLIAPVLSKCGRSDLAYRVVLQETYPGWLYSVKNGATTIWERWDSWTPEKGFHPMGMNSFNHYAYGSVVGWFYDTIAGIKPNPEFPGWKRFRIEPEMGGGLKYAAATLQTPYGEIVSAWSREVDRVDVEISIPANTSASVSLPAESVAAISSGGAKITDSQCIENVRLESGRVHFSLLSGQIRFRIEADGTLAESRI